MKLTGLFRQEDRTLIEQYCEARIWNAYHGDHTSLCRVLGQLLLYVDTRDRSLTPHLLSRGYWEMWVTQAIAAYVKPGMSCIDVGANCGYFTVLLSELVGEKGFVEAFEPQPRLVALLRQSIAVNGFGKQTQVTEAAVGDMDRAATLTEHASLMGSASLNGLAEPSEEVSMRQVQLVTLDGVGYGAPQPIQRPIDFVKIDVQGYELRVLRGMKELIAGSPKIAIAMEFTPTDYENPASAIIEIQGMGLRIAAIGTDGVVRPISGDWAIVPDTGSHRMLWLTRASS